MTLKRKGQEESFQILYIVFIVKLLTRLTLKQLLGLHVKNLNLHVNSGAYLLRNTYFNFEKWTLRWILLSSILT